MVRLGSVWGLARCTWFGQGRWVDVTGQWLSWAPSLLVPYRASREHPSVQEKKKSTIWQL